VTTVLQQVAKCKRDAETSRNLGKWDEAIAHLERAIGLLEAELGTTGKHDPATSRQLRAELADCFGMQGGIYSRTKNFPVALQRYEKGLEHEKALGENSYNLSNFIALSFLQNPSSLPSLRPLIEDGIRLVSSQVGDDGKGARGKQWWAWADLGLFHLLRGQLDEALGRYEKLKETGAKKKNYASMVRVLTDIHKALQGAGHPLAEPVARAIAFLEDRQRSANE
jgi:tetratricopeptide (TPR) repeat protein